MGGGQGSSHSTDDNYSGLEFRHQFCPDWPLLTSSHGISRGSSSETEQSQPQPRNHHRSRIKELLLLGGRQNGRRRGLWSTPLLLIVFTSVLIVTTTSGALTPPSEKTSASPASSSLSSSASYPSSSSSSSSSSPVIVTASSNREPFTKLSRTHHDTHTGHRSLPGLVNTAAAASASFSYSRDVPYHDLDNNNNVNERDNGKKSFSSRTDEHFSRRASLKSSAITDGDGSDNSTENNTYPVVLSWLATADLAGNNDDTFFKSTTTTSLSSGGGGGSSSTNFTLFSQPAASTILITTKGPKKLSKPVTAVAPLLPTPLPLQSTGRKESSSSSVFNNNHHSERSSRNHRDDDGGGGDADAEDTDESLIHFEELPAPIVGVKSRDQIRRDLSRLSARLRSNNNAAAVVTDADNTNANKCDRLYLSGADGVYNGTFESPNLVPEEGHSLQCIYTFVARPNERVEITFTHFNVRGTPPECVHEWVDLYTEVEDTDVSDLISTPFGGRYCGKIPPRRRISLYGGIAIGFYSDKNTTEEGIFKGTFAFINEDRFVVGTPVPRTICSYTILSSAKRQGDLVSPTYPGVYPKKLSCTYKFIGRPSQRIRLEFRDFDLFYGGAHCPFDDVKIYDGMETTAPLIGTYCGQQRNLVVYSSEHLMLVTFTTLARETETQNRGFSGVWEFSESFVKLDFITKNAGEHIRGTECDQKILSQGQSQGNVYSPNYPFPYLPKIVCRYFIYGLQDPQHLERVRLDFDKFDVPTSASVRNSEEDVLNTSNAPKCGDGFLKIYLKGQEVIQAYDKADYEFCGKEVPHDVVSDGPRLVLVFSSGETQGSGFKARYVFETEYRVPGTAAPDGSCRFSYLSSSRKRGEFNSPRHPSNYPSEMNCTYLFQAEPNEQIRLVFDHFKVKADKISNATAGGTYGDMCQEDWVEMYNVWKDREDKLIGRYCGFTAPGPIESREGAQALKLIFHTDEEGVYSGFKARYIFFTAKSIYGECGRNITQDKSGVLTTPNWPNQYDAPQKGEGSSTCNWYLTVRPGSRVMLHFEVFNVEGSPKERGCPAAAVRIWEDLESIPVELCGERLLVDQSQYVSTRNIMRVTFITADKAVGAQGFQAIWTEVQDGGSGPCHHSYFRCEKSKFCIPNELRCNDQKNCGYSETQELDTSDEDHCAGGIESDMNLVLMIVLGLASFLSATLVICVYLQRKRRKRRRRLQLRRPPIHVCDNAGARFAAMDSV